MVLNRQSLLRALPAALLLAAMTAVALAQELQIGGQTLLRAPELSGPRGQPVFFEKGAPRTEAHRLLLTPKVRIRGTQLSAEFLRQRVSVKSLRQIGPHWLAEFHSADAALSAAIRLSKLAAVESAQPLFARQLQPRLIPNDPYFIHDAGNSGYQWHLHNTGDRLKKPSGTRLDLNLVEVWETLRGNGIRIGIVDDGLQINHPDLQANVIPALNWDFNDGDTNPSPGPDDAHGTSCAGVAAARGNNGIGVSGVAPEAGLIGLRLIAAPTDDEDEAAALRWKNDQIHIKSNSWGPGDDSYGAFGPGPLAKQALLDAVTTGRPVRSGGKTVARGTIFIWAGGNGKRSGDDSNYDGWANSPYVIAVGAVGDDEREAPYSEPGSNLLVCAPSNGGAQGITTTDLIGGQGYSPGEYTSDFGGTSSATPAVAGVVALMLNANPYLGWRDVQEILVRSSTQIDEYDGDWVTNGAGFHFHHHYGAGMVNAAAAVQLCNGWKYLGPMTTRSLQEKGNFAIPDKGRGKLSRGFSVSSTDNLRLEHVQVRVSAKHPYRGQLEWWLESPSGVRSRLARARSSDSGADLDWTFTTTHHWGEWSQGMWKLEVEDTTLGLTGTLNDVSIIFMGTAVSGPTPPCVITSSRLIVGREDAELRHQITASNSPVSFRNDGLPPGLSMDANGLISGTPQISGGRDYIAYGELEVSNAAGSATPQSVIYYILAASSALSEALEQPQSTKIIPFGYGSRWYLQTEQTQDGVDAAQSAKVDHREYCGMEWTARGPCSLQFQWKVSSEEDYDYLVLAIDGEVEEIISGETDWQMVRRELSSGSHQVNLYYLKDEARSDGLDAGFVDGLVMTPIVGAPVVKAETIEAWDSQWLNHQLQAENAPDEWSIASAGPANSLPAGLQLDTQRGVINGQTGVKGTFLLAVTASNRFGSDTKTITLVVGDLDRGLGRSLDGGNQLLSSLQYAGDTYWSVQSDYTKDGVLAARSGPIGDLQRSEMSCQVTGPGRLQFFWAVSSEQNCDHLTFFIDGSEQDKISGEVVWQRKEYFLGAGKHTLQWVYNKDNYVRDGLDSGFVDVVSLSVDNDGDGHWSDEEDAFGSSDSDPSSRPRVELLTQGGKRLLRFSSIVGRDYLIVHGSAAQSRKVTLRATATETVWEDPLPLDAAPEWKLYRVTAQPSTPPAD